MPPITKTILTLNVVIFLLQFITQGRLFLSFALWPPGTLGDAPQFQIWQLLTYSFLHGSVTHLFFNMLGLFMFGGDVERVLGSKRFLKFYFASVLAAALAHLIVGSWLKLPPLPTIGASGAVFGILLATAIYFPRRRIMLLFPPIPMQARLFVFLYGMLELYLGITGTAMGIAHFAHIGGMLGGWLMLNHWKKR